METFRHVYYRVLFGLSAGIYIAMIKHWVQNPDDTYGRGILVLVTTMYACVGAGCLLGPIIARRFGFEVAMLAMIAGIIIPLQIVVRFI